MGTRSIHVGVTVGMACIVRTLLAQPIPLRPTELLFYREGQLQQAVLADVEPGGGTMLSVTLGETHRILSADDLPRFMGELAIPISPPSRPATVEVKIEGTQRRGEIEVQPARRWDVYIVPHTHLDIGFTDLQEKVWAELAHNLEDVIELCEKTADWPDGSRFHWTIEGTALFENFARRHPRERVERLAGLIRAGRVELTACWVNLLTELAGPESLVRAFYPARRLSDGFGIRIDTLMLNDVPGYTWCLPQICAQMGIRYANLRANGIRGKFVWDRPGAVPRPFRWESPDGSQLVCWYTDSYREANFLRHEFPADPGVADSPQLQRMLYQSIAGHLQRAARSGYEREVLQLRMGGDNLTAVESVCRWVRHWNERWAYPRLRIATSRQFFHALTNDGRDVPVHRGDIPDWWADGAASSARQTADARLAHDRAVALETLLALPDGPATDSAADTFADVHRQLLLYAEHTWGASGEWYEKDMAMVEGQWAVKRGYTERATETLSTAGQQWGDAVAAWAKPARDSILVFNTLSWARSDVVRVPAGELPDTFVLRDRNGQPVPVQKDGDAWCFIARDVPSLGYALFEVAAGPAPTDRPAEMRYDLTFDTEPGAITSARHRPAGRELIDPASRFRFNQYVYETGPKREHVMPTQFDAPRSPRDKTIRVAEPAEQVAHAHGPVFERITTRTRGPNAPLIEQSYTAYADLDRLDITNRLQKTATPQEEGVHFAFPLATRSPRCRLEIPYATMQPGAEQLRYSCADFYSLYHWLEFWDDEGGVLWASIEAPVVVLGDLWPECWHDDLEITNGELFSYVMTNYWFTNYRRGQGGELTFRYQLQAYTGGPDNVRSFRFGSEAGTPLMAQVVASGGGDMVKARSWFGVGPDHVMITALKRADDGEGWIVRLMELGVGDCLARLRLPTEWQWSAVRSDPVERDLQPLTIIVDRAGPTVEVALRRSEVATIRLESMRGASPR